MCLSLPISLSNTTLHHILPFLSLSPCFSSLLSLFKAFAHCPTFPGNGPPLRHIHFLLVDVDPLEFPIGLIERTLGVGRNILCTVRILLCLQRAVLGIQRTGNDSTKGRVDDNPHVVKVTHRACGVVACVKSGPEKETETNKMRISTRFVYMHLCV